MTDQKRSAAPMAWAAKTLLALCLAAPAWALAQAPDAEGQAETLSSEMDPDLATEQAAPPPAPVYCTDEEYRQFDFWLGEWTVTSNGQFAGTNHVHRIHGDCALQENWVGGSAGGIRGTSFNLYDRATGRWHQTWVDSSGTLLLLDGGLVDGSMVLSGKRPTSDGSGVARHRISFTPNEDGTVRQLWEASQDDGASWTVLFDGLYTRNPASTL